MCDPVTGTMAALSVVSTGVGFLQDDANARATNRYNKEMFERNKELAEESSVVQHEGLAAQRSQERAAASRETVEVSREADMARSTARVAALEAGNSGASLDALLDEYDRQEADFAVTTRRNERYADEQFERNSTAIGNQQEGRIDSARRQKVARPSFLNTALQMGSGALNTTLASPTTGARLEAGGGSFKSLFNL